MTERLQEIWTYGPCAKNFDIEDLKLNKYSLLPQQPNNYRQHARPHRPPKSA